MAIVHLATKDLEQQHAKAEDIRSGREDALGSILWGHVATTCIN